MNESKVLTLAEFEVECERIAIARLVCRTGKYPSARDVARERGLMGDDVSHGVKAWPVVTRQDASAFLSVRGIATPAKDAENHRTAYPPPKKIPAPSVPQWQPNGGKLPPNA